MSNNYESPCRYFCGSSQLTNLILDSGETCHMTPQFSFFIPVSLEDIDNNIKVTDENHVTEK